MNARGRTDGARMWAANDLRRRWRSLVVLGLLAGLSAGLALAALAGARRADTAFDRLRIQTRGADAVVFTSQVELYQGDWSELRALPYVKQVAPWNLVFGTSPGDAPGSTLFVMPTRGGWLQSLDRPVVREGRMWKPSAVGEIVVDEIAAQQHHIAVGDKVPFTAFARGQNASGTPAGAHFTVRVVGVIREPSQFLFTGGLIFLSPGTGKHYGKRIETIANAHLQLRHPTRDIARLRHDVNHVFAPGTPVLDLHSVERRIGTAISVERVAQLLLGIAVALAGIVFVGQALARSVSTIDDDALVLRSIGLTRGGRTLAGALPHLLTVAVAIPIALGGALALSPRFPIGFARGVDPDVGLNADWTVLGPGLIGLGVLLLGAAVAVAWHRSGMLDRESPTPTSRVAAAVRRVMPLPVGLGTTMAFEPGRGRRRVPVRAALLGSIAGVLGIVAAFTVAHGLDEALANPAAAGVAWDATVAAGGSDYGKGVDAVAPAFVRALRHQPDAAATAVLGRVVVDVNGAGVAVFDVKPIRGQVRLVTLTGHAPVGPHQAAIGPSSARQLGVGIGDRITIRGHGRRTFTIVGTSLFPNEVHSGFTEGVWVTPAAMHLVGQTTDPTTQSGMEQFAVLRWRSGIEHRTALTRLRHAMGSGQRTIGSAEVPPELQNLRRVRSMPTVLVLFLVLLAMSTLAHVLVTSIRRRRAEFAILRAIGFTRRMTAGLVAAHGTVVGIVGLMVGIPLGLVTGRLAWKWVTNEVPLVYTSPVTLAFLVLAVPATLLVTNLVAAIPGWRAARLAPATVLRSE